MMRTYFTRTPESDLADITPCLAWVMEYECCYTSAYQFFLHEQPSLDEQEAYHAWVALRDQAYYLALEDADRARARAAKLSMLRDLRSASDGGAWSATFDDDLVLGYVPSLGVCYALTPSRPALWVFADTRDLVEHLKLSPRIAQLLYALFNLEQLAYVCAPP